MSRPFCLPGPLGLDHVFGCSKYNGYRLEFREKVELWPSSVDWCLNGLLHTILRGLDFTNMTM